MAIICRPLSGSFEGSSQRQMVFLRKASFIFKCCVSSPKYCERFHCLLLFSPCATCSWVSSVLKFTFQVYLKLTLSSLAPKGHLAHAFRKTKAARNVSCVPTSSTSFSWQLLMEVVCGVMLVICYCQCRSCRGRGLERFDECGGDKSAAYKCS